MFKRKPIEIELPALHPGQRLVRDSKARFKVLACGRRWGKSQLSAALATEAALQRGVVWIITPTYALGDPLWTVLRRLAAQIPSTRLNRVDRRIDYPGGGYVQIKTGDNPSLLRGVGLDLAVFDEAAHTDKLEELWVEVVRPALADRKGKALFCSTPAGRNYFWHLFMLGSDPDETDWDSWQQPTGVSPFIATSEIHAARRQMTERQFAQEWLAEFAEDGGVFQNVKDLASARQQPQRLLGHAYVAGVDWGRSNDATVIAILDCQLNEVCHLTRLLSMPYEQQIDRLKYIVRLFQPSVVVAELNSMGTPLVERLILEGLPIRGFQTTNASKMAIVDGLVMAFERGQLRILDDAVLLRELELYQAETMASGLVRYSAPHGQHDDTVIATALAWSAVNEMSSGGFCFRYA